MKWAIFLVLALAASGCQTQGDTGGEVTASTAGQKSGTIYRSDGARYTGQLKDGRPHGQGTSTWPHRERHTGQYRNGKRHGKGTYTWPNGDRYTGQYRNDKKHGYGTMKFVDGRTYSGQFRDGLQHGPGTMLERKRGISYKGPFRNGKPHGVGTCTMKAYNNGKPYACRCNMGNCKNTSR